MDDVRALKKIINDTKETIVNKRRQKILDSLANSNWGKFQASTYHKNLLRTHASIPQSNVQQNT